MLYLYIENYVGPFSFRWVCLYIQRNYLLHFLEIDRKKKKVIEITIVTPYYLFVSEIIYIYIYIYINKEIEVRRNKSIGS